MSHFHPTHWTLVLQASGQGEHAKAALSDLCSAYYEPVVAFLKRDGQGEDRAREKAHAFFENLLIKGVGSPMPNRGRFRSYLLGALKHFLSKQRDAARASKRGGTADHLSLDNHQEELGGVTNDDALFFDREWALTLIARALQTLEQEHSKDSTKAHIFTQLKPWLGVGVTGSQKEAASTLGISETATKVTIHRLRARFRELIRAEVASTVDGAKEVAEELQHLVAIASRAL